MVNEMADFFRPYPEAEAIASVAAHIRAFWDPRMRRALAAEIAAGDAGLSALARAGAEQALAQDKAA
jgi:formate dehydrogenase subunit delta